ncbi:hypothetical protein, partial [Staphylococcus aureus]|uniref:hypothetical protein n=1 Tax=Staphylococcus aureus TaxID=1280 RepID=UPI001C7D7C55
STDSCNVNICFVAAQDRTVVCTIFFFFNAPPPPDLSPIPSTLPHPAPLPFYLMDKKKGETPLFLNNPATSNFNFIASTLPIHDPLQIKKRKNLNKKVN